MCPAANPLRLFVAVYPPPEAAAAILGVLDSMDLAEHRRTPEGQVHMTLQFIGDTDERELGSVWESVERGAAGVGAFKLTPMRVVTLPERGTPRLVALVTDAPAGLMEIQRRLVKRLARNPRGEQRFTPHFTLCRFAHGARAERVNQQVRIEGFEVREVVLMRSVLRPEGARHEPVTRVTLS